MILLGGGLFTGLGKGRPEYRGGPPFLKGEGTGMQAFSKGDPTHQGRKRSWGPPTNANWACTEAPSTPGGMGRKGARDLGLSVVMERGGPQKNPGNGI